LNGQGVDARFQQFGKCGVHHAVLFDTGFAAKGIGDDFNAEMAFAVRPGAGVAGVVVRLVEDFQA
jgi:hypothetical protein